MEDQIIIMPSSSNRKGPGKSWKQVNTSQMEISTFNQLTSKRMVVRNKKERSKRSTILIGMAIFIVVGMASILLIDSSDFQTGKRSSEQKKSFSTIPTQTPFDIPRAKQQENEHSKSPPSVEHAIIEKTNLQLIAASQPTPSPAPTIQPPQKQSQKIIPGNVVESHTPFTQHLHTGSVPTFTYPTMGMHQPGSTFNFTEVKNNQFIEYQTQMIELLRPYNDTDCILERYGDEGDGGYLMCNNFVNKSVGLVNLGVQGRDMFGCQLTSVFPMPNLQYDCTNNRRTECPSNNAANIFELACLSDKSQNKNGVQFYSLKDIVDSHNLTHKHVIMKIDIEGAQWPGFRAFPIEYLDFVDQFILEIHNPFQGLRHKAFWGNLEIIKSLQQKFVSVNLHSNTGACYAGLEAPLHKLPAFAIQVSLVNRKLITLKSQSRSYTLHHKNRLNGGGLNCQLHD